MDRLLTLALASMTVVGAQPQPDASNCTTLYFEQRIDHFSWRVPSTGNLTYQQRYLVCDQYYAPGGSIFFYTGNEGDVTLYANASGLMWENAGEFNALLVFAEHRYYGESWPQGAGSPAFDYLSSSQALADYAVLLRYIKVIDGATSCNL